MSAVLTTKACMEELLVLFLYTSNHVLVQSGKLLGQFPEADISFNPFHNHCTVITYFPQKNFETLSHGLGLTLLDQAPWDYYCNMAFLSLFCGRIKYNLYMV